MNFEHIYSDFTGLAHLIFSLLAVVSGTIVLINRKGTSFHMLVGRIYGLSMIGLLVTAFMIYNLYGRFAIFHWMAVVSTVTLLGGMVPMYPKKPTSYISLHFNFMYWSVMGLYGAFVAEMMVRIPKIVIEDGSPNAMFYNMIGIAVFVVMGLAYYGIKKKQKQWASFDKSG